MSVQNMSLFIPAVFKNISAERIISAFEKVKLGKVSHVNFIDKNEKFNYLSEFFYPLPKISGNDRYRKNN